jgi:hypothetical protein
LALIEEENPGAARRTFRSGLVADLAIAFLGLVCIWEGILKTYNHYNSIWANSEPLDYFIAGLSIAVGASLLISFKGPGKRPSYTFPLLGMVFGAFKIYTDLIDPGDILVSTVLIAGSLILLAQAFRLERKWVVTALAECWLTILAWTVDMLIPNTSMFDYSLLFAWVTMFFALALGLNAKLRFHEQRLSVLAGGQIPAQGRSRSILMKEVTPLATTTKGRVT